MVAAHFASSSILGSRWCAIFLNDRRIIPNCKVQTKFLGDKYGARKLLRSQRCYPTHKAYNCNYIVPLIVRKEIHPSNFVNRVDAGAKPRPDLPHGDLF